MNAFESGERKVIPAVLIYARASADGRLLLIHRNTSSGAGPRDYHAGKWNGLGGKLEPGESPREGARREFREEAGLELPEARFRELGFLQFPNFKAHKNEDWFVVVLTADLTPAEVESAVATNAEGELHWKTPAELGSLNFWPGDRHFLPYVLERRPFAGTIWYRGSEVARYAVEALLNA